MNRLSYIVENCRNNQDNYCKGYIEPGILPGTTGDAYISTVILSTGVVRARGSIWGYDLAVDARIKTKTLNPVYEVFIKV